MSSLSGTQYDSDLPAAGRNANGPQAGQESALLRQAQNGDRAAYGQIVVVYQDRLYNAVLRMVGDADEAAELTQEAFARGLSKLDSFRGEAGPYTWLFRIAFNLAISSLRKNQRQRTISLDSPGAQGSGDGRDRSSGQDQAAGLMDKMAQNRSAGPLETLELRERDQHVLAALERIDAQFRALLVMRDVEGFDYQQMAQVLDLPLGTLKSRLFRARMALREQLKGYLADGPPRQGGK